MKWTKVKLCNKIIIMEWEEYEKIVAHIYKSLGRNIGVKILGFGNTCKRKDKSGVYHQIDVLTAHSDGIHKYLTAIECKFWNEKVNKDPIMKLEEIIKDLNISQGVIVSKKGFTSDAIKYAKHTDIKLIELRDHNSSTKEGRFTKYYVHNEWTTTNLHSVSMQTTEGEKENLKNSSFFKEVVNDYTVVYENGKEKNIIEFIVPFLNEKVLKDKIG